MNMKNFVYYRQTQDGQLHQDYLYVDPWNRYQSYGVGVVFGFILFKCKGKLPVSRVSSAM